MHEVAGIVETVENGPPEVLIEVFEVGSQGAPSGSGVGGVGNHGVGITRDVESHMYRVKWFAFIYFKNTVAGFTQSDPELAQKSNPNVLPPPRDWSQTEVRTDSTRAFSSHVSISFIDHLFIFSFMLVGFLLVSPSPYGVDRLELLLKLARPLLHDPNTVRLTTERLRQVRKYPALGPLRRCLHGCIDLLRGVP